jgi:energy-converting hydrogenase B subunit D
MTAVQVVARAAVALVAPAIVFGGPPLRRTMALSIFGLALTVLFFVFQAPDVALSEIAVSTLGLPVMLLLALRKVREQEREREEQESS